MPQVPAWRPEPEQVWIRCQQINNGTYAGELVAQFKVNGDEFTTFVPEKYVDKTNKLLRALIVADFGDSWLIDIPAETLTSGSRIRVRSPEKKEVVVTAAK